MDASATPSSRDESPVKITDRAQYSEVSQDAESGFLSKSNATPPGEKATSVREADRPHNLTTRMSTFWASGWTNEICSCVLAVVALVGLIIFLGSLDGGNFTRMPFSLSMNTIVAIFTAVIKAALLVPVSEGTSPYIIDVVWRRWC
jgi:hypothetical protein